MPSRTGGRGIVRGRLSRSRQAGALAILIAVAFAPCAIARDRIESSATLNAGLNAVVSGLAGRSQPVVVSVQAHAIATTTTITSTENPTLVGQMVTFTAHLLRAVPNDTRPTGTVTFTDTHTGIVLGTAALEETTASLPMSTLAAGSYHVQATYSGDRVFASSRSPALIQVIQQLTLGSTSTRLTASTTRITPGESTVLTAVVDSPFGTPSGEVSFNDGPIVLGVVKLDPGGRAALHSPLLSEGAHIITVHYSGDSTFSNSNSTELTVTAARPNTLSPTTTTLEASANPGVSGSVIALTATVGSSGSGTPTGTVTFWDGSVALGVAPLEEGVATENVSLSAGTHALLASYSGDSNFAVSVGTLSEVVTGPPGTTPTIIILSSSANPSVNGEEITYMATVYGGPKPPTGSVTFNAGNIVATVIITPVNLDNTGVASFSTSALRVGTSGVSAVYSGDSFYAPSISPLLTQRVNPAPTTTTLVSSANPSLPGKSVTFTASVAVNPPGSGAPAGTVSFSITDVRIALCQSVTLEPDGTAACTTGNVPPGSHTVTATYSGNDQFSPSGGGLLQMVQQFPSVTTVTGPSQPPVYGTTATFIATVKAGAGTGMPDGTVSFLADSSTGLCSSVALKSGTAACSTNALTAGRHSITATYSGNSNFVGSAGQTSATVMRATTSIRLTNSETQGALTLAAAVAVTSGAGTPTGSVSFVLDGIATLCTAGLQPSGIAVCIPGALAPGSHTIAATYGGDANFNGSSGQVSIGYARHCAVPNHGPQLVSSANPAASEQPITFTATIRSCSRHSGEPGGTVSFVLNGTTTLCGNISVESGHAKCTGKVLPPGSHSIVANYSGDSGHPAFSASLTEVVLASGSARIR